MPRLSAIPVLALLLAPHVAAGQGMAVRRVAPREVPAGAPHRGAVEEARAWRDRTGENLLILSRTAEVQADNGEGDPLRAREIYAYHYVRQGAGYRLLWQTMDFVRDCEFDLTLELRPGSLQVTDVDADGIAETSYVYRLGCMGGVDPWDMKVILHEGATKYAVRGFTDLRALGPGYPAPQMQMDAALRRDPALRALAERQRRRYVRVTREEMSASP